MKYPLPVRSLILPLLFPLLMACGGYKKPANLELYGLGSGVGIYGLSKKSVDGTLNLSGGNAKNETLRYLFQPALELPAGSSLELEYRFPTGYAGTAAAREELKAFAAQYQVVVRTDAPGSAAWELPLDASFIGFDQYPRRIRYYLPLPASRLENFSVGLESRSNSGTPSTKTSRTEAPVLELCSLSIAPRWYGFSWDGASSGEETLQATPFVFQAPEDPATLYRSWVITPLYPYGPEGRQQILLRGAGSAVSAEMATLRYEYAVPAQPLETLLVPWALLSGEAFPLTLSTETPPRAMILSAAANQVFPVEPILADPGIVLAYPQTAWRDRRYEVFRWASFPQILIFDTADYEVQDRLFKRLAFFTEKPGFRGRLAPDEEIAGLHGWNAHDYDAAALARFFDLAEKTNFPLLAEERELKAILLDAGIINLADGSLAGEPWISPGEGAIVSISRDKSGEYLRSRFMVHEGFHGLYFIDEDFREFSRRRWESLASVPKRFIISYFEYLNYDSSDTNLMINEFMAYCLQQSVSQAPSYFGEYLGGIIADHPWRHTVLPPRDEERDYWPEIADAFRAEAAAFSSYVNRRWGLAAGRIRHVLVEETPSAGQ